MNGPSVKEYREWYEKHHKRIMNDYFTLLRFPSISTDPAYKNDVRACAEWLKNFLSNLGLETELWETPKHPVLFASMMKAGPDKPTVMIYNHYDVQPADPLDLWKNPPFEPTLRDGQVYARGASDNKGQLFFVLTAVQAYLELAKSHQINLKLFIEGEEECASFGSRQILKPKQEQLRADYCLILDAGLPKPGIPAVTLGLRGLITMNVTIRNAASDLHSGCFGGIVLNPLQALVTALSRFWAHGKVAIPGFYDDVVEFPKEEFEKLHTHFDKDELQQRYDIRAFGGEAGYSIIESNWIRPTVEINGLCGGYTGQGFKTVLPSQAHVKISCRLVPNQNPEKIADLVVKYLKSQLPKDFDVQVEIHPGGDCVRTSSESLIAKNAKMAYEEVFSQPAHFIFSSASIPIVAELAKTTQASVALMGTATHEDDIHAPNEHFSLQQFEQGYLTLARTLSLMGES